MKILLCGDTHGNTPILAYYQKACSEHVNIDAAIHVGDFGFYSSIFKNKVKWWLPFKTYAIDGNHENHPWLARNSRLHAHQWLSDRNIIYQPRGSVVSFGSSKIGFLGGAMNVDREQEEILNTTNYATEDEAKAAIEIFNKEQPELIVTHSCPHSIGVKMRGHPAFESSISTFIHKLGFTTGSTNDCGEEALKTLWEGLEYKPKAWVYGHFHKYHVSHVDGVHFMCVGRTDSLNKSMMPIIWDTESLEIECFPNIKI